MSSPNSSLFPSSAACLCPTYAAVEWAERCLEGVALPATGMMGVVGNIAAILVFRYKRCHHFTSVVLNCRHHQHPRSTFHYLLIVLAVVDSLCLVSLIVDHSMVGVWGIRPVVYVYILPYFWYPLKNIILSWETFLTMAIALERFIAVCRYLHFSSWLSF